MKYKIMLFRMARSQSHFHIKTGRFAKIIFYFLRSDKQKCCTAAVTKKAVNWGEGEGMQVLWILKYRGKKKHE